MNYLNENDYTVFFEYMKNVIEFKNELNDLSKKWDQLILFSQLSSAKIDMNSTKINFDKLSDQLILNLAEATLKKVIEEMNSKAQVSVDIVIRNLFERTADIGFLSTDSEIRYFLKNYNIGNLLVSKDAVNKLTKRFEEYVAKYSVYYDIVLFDLEGNILVKLDNKNQTIFKSKDLIFEEIESSKCDYLETYKYHDFIPQHNKSLIYSYKVQDENSDKTLGYLSLCFKFTNEMQTIFSSLVSNNNKEVLTLLDKNYEVIASSDRYHIPLGARVNIALDKPYALTQFAGRDYIVKTCKTNGYEGFFGLGWMGHIMIPLDSAFKSENSNIQLNDEILTSIMQNKNLFKEELISIPFQAQGIQDDLDKAVWNGNITQSISKLTEGDFARSILREIKLAGEKTKKSFASSIEKLNETIVSSLLNNVSFLASLAIDIMDRNLYERANDCRWWALTPAFVEILAKEHISSEDIIQMTEILKYINGLYTVYENIFIYDKSGTIIAISNDKYKSVVRTKLDNSWVKNTLKLRDSSRYYVSYFDKSFLYDDKYTFIFNASINDDKQNLGGIGIVFDSETQFRNMLIDALPSTKKGVPNEGYFSLYVEKNYSTVLSCSDLSHYVGEKIDLDNDFLNLKQGKSLSKILYYKNKYYLVGATCSRGYREFKNEEDTYQKEIIAFVFVEVGEKIIKNENRNKYNHFFSYDESLLEKNSVEIATFYIGNKWLGVKTSEVIEAINLNNLEKPITMDATTHHFKGTIIHKKMVLSVLDISKFIQNDITPKDNADVIIIKYDENKDSHVIGIVIDKLGEIIKVPSNRIKPFEKHLIGGGMLAESIVQPPESSTVSNLLSLLNISKLDEMKKELIN